MKVLITYASAGAGHRRIAEAVYEHLRANRPELKLELTDVLSKANPFFSLVYKEGYAFLVRHLSWLWGLLFWLTEFKLLRHFSRRIACLADLLSCRNFLKYLIREKFDYIISTHFLPAQLAAGLKVRKIIQAKLFTVITDFGVHPFWVSEGTDLYIAASGLTGIKLLHLGVKREKIRDSGIPFNVKFTRDKNRPMLARKLGISADRFTVLLMTGSFGVGPLEKIARSISYQVQVLVVCADNKRLFIRLKENNPRNVTVFGFVDNADELMAVSDLIITKPGGSSIAELINMGILPLFICAIPGQEKENVHVLSSYGVGYEPKSLRQINDLILELKDNPQRLERLRADIARIRKPFACREISDVIR